MFSFVLLVCLVNTIRLCTSDDDDDYEQNKIRYRRYLATVRDDYDSKTLLRHETTYKRSDRSIESFSTEDEKEMTRESAKPVRQLLEELQFMKEVNRLSDMTQSIKASFEYEQLIEKLEFLQSAKHLDSSDVALVKTIHSLYNLNQKTLVTIERLNQIIGSKREHIAKKKTTDALHVYEPVGSESEDPY